MTDADMIWVNCVKHDLQDDAENCPDCYYKMTLPQLRAYEVNVQDRFIDKIVNIRGVHRYTTTPFGYDKQPNKAFDLVHKDLITNGVKEDHWLEIKELKELPNEG